MSRVDDAIFASINAGRTSFDTWVKAVRKQAPAKFNHYIRPNLVNVVDFTGVDNWIIENTETLDAPPKRQYIQPGIYYTQYRIDNCEGVTHSSFVVWENDQEQTCIMEVMLWGTKLVKSTIVYITLLGDGEMQYHQIGVENWTDEELVEEAHFLSNIALRLEWAYFLGEMSPEAIKIPRVSRKEVRRRMRERIPQYRLKVVDMGLPPREYIESGAPRPPSMGKMGTALHSVRGHIRQYAKGKYTWVTPHWKGDAKFGVVQKTVKAKPRKTENED